jgi:hypothetical protein
MYIMFIDWGFVCYVVGGRVRVRVKVNATWSSQKINNKINKTQIYKYKSRKRH